MCASGATRPLAGIVEVSAQTADTPLVHLDSSKGLCFLVIEQRGFGAQIFKGSLFIGEREGLFFLDGQAVPKEF